MRLTRTDPADVCLILEGTYPYVPGGVSGWTHELIKMNCDLTFSLVALVCKDAATKLVYELPPNVVSVQTLRLQCLSTGGKMAPHEIRHLFADLEHSLKKLQGRADLKDFSEVFDSLAPCRERLGAPLLLDSQFMWNLLLKIYSASMPKTPFLDYFWSWRGLFGGLFSILLADLPPARVYHALCTGYAGLLLARAHLETKRPCLVTEHGIYTNERRIEIASSDWINSNSGMDLTVASATGERELKDLWIDTFSNYSIFCYQAAHSIITLFEGNQEFQRMDGAEPEKMRVIPNGIDTEAFAYIERKPHPPTIALIGRIVPIKDVKTFIKAVHMLKQTLPDLRAYLLGPSEEDLTYAQECRALVDHFAIGETLIFAGKVDIREYLGLIDINVLTSLSEAQPLVILEAGAAGIPTVATDVGACREMIMGVSDENPAFGPGGDVVPLANADAVARACRKLLSDSRTYKSCSNAIRGRVHHLYNKERQRRAYAALYDQLIHMEPTAAGSDLLFQRTA